MDLNFQIRIGYDGTVASAGFTPGKIPVLKFVAPGAVDLFGRAFDCPSADPAKLIEAIRFEETLEPIADGWNLEIRAIFVDGELAQTFPAKKIVKEKPPRFNEEGV